MRNEDFIGGWLGGMNSILPPSAIQRTQYAWGENVINRGGIVQTRPGFEYKFAVPGKLFQGFHIFTPTGSVPIMLIAVDGIIYTSQYPFTSFSALADISFSSTAKFVTFATCIKSVSRKVSDGTLTIIPPYALVVIQDGVSPAAYYDGVSAQTLTASAPSLGTPTGTWMAWAGSRLWVAVGSQIVASDIADPLSFSENTYVAEQSNFQLDGPCTGMIASDDQRSLLVFTEDTTTSILAYIHTRTQWQTTPNFITVILPNIGCAAGRSCVNQYGLTHWFTHNGFINLNSALSSLHTSQLITIDDQMMRSKRNLSSDLSGIAAVAFENIILVSVPSASKYNAHTWMLDQTPSGQSGNAPLGGMLGGNMAWAGAWSGLRPQQWASCSINNGKKLYAACYDATARDGSQIHIWQAMKSEKLDNNNPIQCQMETCSLIETGDLRKFSFAEIEVCEIYGPVKLQCFVRGLRGPWIEIMSKELLAEKGCFGSSLATPITNDTTIQTFKPQSRTVRTRDFNPQDLDALVESDLTPGTDKGFGLLFQWSGIMGIRNVKFVTADTSTKRTGSPEIDESDSLAINDLGIEVEA